MRADSDISPQNHRHKLSAELARLGALCNAQSVTLRSLTKAMGTRGHALLSLFLGFPFLFPIPLPGLSIFFGACIVVTGALMAMGKPLWFPKSWMERPLSANLLRKVFQGGEKMMLRLEVWIKPRGAFIHAYPWIKALHGSMFAVCGALLALPLPPGTNFPPALAILLLAIGSLEEDGAFLFLGYIAFIINIALFTVLPFLGIQGIRALWG
ncbi:MAG: exopolysaccharide biosynthesis protein [Deltaproteobacteria bacterium]|nr:exopolysaccharide biosynthesis protein [Deltaproteobacteria bacterium]